VINGSSSNVLRQNTARDNQTFDALDDGSGTANVWSVNKFGTTQGI
jgi:hypothetical protein